jgi:lipopolysaccharide transport system ATP-binding protein
MSDTVIRVENISKLYRLGEVGTGTISHDLNRWWHRVRGKEDPYLKVGQTNDRTVKSNSDYAWALKDISFEVKRGQVLGIIGRNGAGKSTLLKILSRVTMPTSGEIKIKGRVASLLEVGTGFNPELTGRDNIYLNGAILGMRRREINQKFDEIVGFSGVERYIDTPVKRYSSGMYVRLAFAVAAHLEPEILIVDEVLAVGDADFQKKCLGKMQDVAGHGRTILFVSHNIAAISNLCSHAIVLEKGRKLMGSPVAEAITNYIQTGLPKSGEILWPRDPSAEELKKVRLHSVRIISEGRVAGEVPIDKPIHFQIMFETLETGLEISAGLHIVHPVKGDVLSTANFPSACLEADPLFGKELPAGFFCASCTLPGLFLNEGEYLLNVVLFKNVRTIEVFERDVLRFQVLETGVMRKEWNGVWIGVVRPRLMWKTEAIQP